MKIDGVVLFGNSFSRSSSFLKALSQVLYVENKEI